MREIKFRWYDNIKGKMCNGESLYWNGEKFIVGIWNFEETHIVDGETEPLLMQYTGLKDKNGIGLTEVYEGDIIDKNGIIKGSIYEVDKAEADIVVPQLGTKALQTAYKEIMARGFGYSE